MTTFDEIHILDLHGNSLRKEKCPDGSKDVNVFDIQQGVAIALFIKKKGKKKSVFHTELWGERESKYSWLQDNDINSTEWKSITPKSEHYLFIPRNESLYKVFSNYFMINDIFRINRIGIFTSRDEFVIDTDKNKLKRRIMQFRDKKLPDSIIQQTFDLENKPHWKLETARELVINDTEWEKALTKILYRPFDERFIFYHDAIIERGRWDIMSNMVQDNLGLCVGRQWGSVGSMSYDVVFASRSVTDLNLFMRGGAVLFPLYIYPSQEKKGLFHAEEEAREPNIKSEIIKSLSKAYKKELSPEEIFYYIYAVLYSVTYRTKYAEFLKIDFPRVPFTKDYKLFKKMSEHGNRLVNLHLLKSQELDSPIARFQVEGSNRAEKPKYDDNAGRVYINKEQYFEGISGEVWSYQIGGYQVCDKWLKDRKGRILTLDEIQTYCRIVTAIKNTIEIQTNVDEIYTQAEDSILPIT